MFQAYHGGYICGCIFICLEYYMVKHMFQADILFVQAYKNHPNGSMAEKLQYFLRRHGWIHNKAYHLLFYRDHSHFIFHKMFHI